MSLLFYRSVQCFSCNRLCQGCIIVKISKQSIVGEWDWLVDIVITDQVTRFDQSGDWRSRGQILEGHTLCVLTQSRGCTTNAWIARRLISNNLQKHLPRHLKLNHISATYGCLHQWILALTGTDVRTYTCIRTKGWRDHSSCAWHPHASCGMASSMSSKTVQPWAGHCHLVVANVYVHIWRAPSLSECLGSNQPSGNILDETFVIWNYRADKLKVFSNIWTHQGHTSSSPWRWRRMQGFPSWLCAY